MVHGGIHAFTRVTHQAEIEGKRLNTLSVIEATNYDIYMLLDILVRLV